MSELKELCAVGDASIFPGHILSPPRLIEFAEAEEEAAGQYVRRIAKASAGLPDAVRQAMHQRAVDNLRSSPFSYGSPGFDQWALSMSALPFLAWLLLRIKHPKLTLAEAGQLLCADDYAGKVSAVWSMWGYQPTKKVPAPPVHFGSSTGGEFSPPSPSLRRAGVD